MFREMRRKKQQLTKNECIDVLQTATSGVLAVRGDDDYPYAVPLSYVYANDKIYFHCAKQGHKLDAVRNYDKVSFCVIGEDNIIPDEFTTYFKSVIIFGRARILTDENEIFSSIKALAQKYSPNLPETEHLAEIQRFHNSFYMVEITIEHITGKQAIELVRMQNKPDKM